jgi:hypothetical protein
MTTDRRARSLALELAQDVDARAVREPQVEQHRGRPVLGEEAQAFAHGGGGKGLVPAGLEELHAGLPDHVVIVDDEGRREPRLQHPRMLSSVFGRWE